MTVLVIYFQRIAIHKLPAREVIVSVFLPIGPLGQGGFAIMQLGSVALRIFSERDTLNVQTTGSGNVLYVVGWLMALVMWGFGLIWLFFAIASITRHQFPFNMGWWVFAFPLGVFATSTVLLGDEIPSATFHVLGTLFSIVVVLLWIVVAAGTIQKAWTGEIFVVPCLNNVENEECQAAKQLKEASP
ncbi:Plasma membrane sulfite pump involved in sulfite metabolism [Sticta canariensis]|nr:Plasma membrane sulfite pump involved in sulfite metabolism [Sticta canariensis]